MHHFSLTNQRYEGSGRKKQNMPLGIVIKYWDIMVLFILKGNIQEANNNYSHILSVVAIGTCLSLINVE